MSHSKYNKRGRSFYLDNWNPAGKKYILTCALCGKQGYSPAIEEPDFCDCLERDIIFGELIRVLPGKLVLNEWGHCEECARRMEPL